ncbi:3-deoxy-manno-octulosonate cytidylyltransferase [Pelagibacteraceae bacterium]|nr:3-deoxy-manno-octulosonate cytidylyltransferase [Pelagibacteraceae bacterium]
MKSIIIIPSRMESTRLPGKPMIKIDGIPMIQRVWEQAINSKIGDVYVACAEKVVFDLITTLGGKAILTNPNLPTGTDRVYEAYLEIKNSNKFDNIINLQGDMPLIKSEDIREVLNPLNNNYSIGTLATTLQNLEYKNPNVTKVEVAWLNNNIGTAKNFFRLNDNISNKIFHHVGIYSYTISSLSKFVKLPKSKNENYYKLEQFRALDSNIKIGVSFVSDIPISVDTKEDLIIAENIIKARNEKN